MNLTGRQAVLFSCLGLILQSTAQEDRAFGTCPLSMSETGECAYSHGGQPNATIQGMGNDTMEYVPVDLGASIGGQPAPTHYAAPNRTTSRGSIRALKKQDDNIIQTHWGEDQTVGVGADVSQIRRLVEKTDHYMRHIVFKKKEYRKVRKHCLNQVPACSQWAVQGECQSNRKYMQLHCAPACQTCEMLDVQTRCPTNKTSAANAWGPGDLNQLFERITTDPFYTEQFGPVHILSRPHLSRKERTRLNGHNSHHLQEDGPWLVSMDSFLTAKECVHLMQLADEEGYEPSSEVGNPRYDGTREHIRSGGRTSYNAWCGEKCEKHETAQRVLHKLQNLTGIPHENIEHLQLLRYESGEQYKNHYDFSPYERERPQGGRLLTVFLYLNDVKEGGKTEFTGLSHPVAVTPKLGRALIWPNVLDHDPTHSMDRRTKHRALPMGKGVKYGVNAWFHQRDFRTPHSLDCTA